MEINKQPIGVFDSGVGGLTVLSNLATLLPHENLLYLGDTARVPYGNRSAETIRCYARQCMDFLLARSVKFILVACNTVSALALTELQRMSPVPILGVIEPVARALRHRSKGRIGIIGTRATIDSQAYEKQIRLLNNHTELFIFSVACPLFVPLAEEGWHKHPATYSIAQEYLAPLQDAQIDALILGCTHYPLLKEVIETIMPTVKLIDSSEEAATLTAEFIFANQLGQPLAHLNDQLRTIECFVTDLTPMVIRIAHQFLSLSTAALHEVSIEHTQKLE